MFLDLRRNLKKAVFSSSPLGGMLLTGLANAGVEHPRLGGRGDEGIGGREGDHHHPPPRVHLALLGGNCTAMVASANLHEPPFFKFAPFRLG